MPEKHQAPLGTGTHQPQDCGTNSFLKHDRQQQESSVPGWDSPGQPTSWLCDCGCVFFCGCVPSSSPSHPPLQNFICYPCLPEMGAPLLCSFFPQYKREDQHLKKMLFRKITSPILFLTISHLNGIQVP